MNDWDFNLAKEIAKGIASTGIEGGYDTVVKSTAYSYPSIGLSCWEGDRANNLLRMIPGGEEFVNRTYVNIQDSDELPMLRELLRSEAGQKAQLELLSRDCLKYVEELKEVPTLDDTRCMIYCGMWCPTSTYVVKRFLQNRYMHVDLRSLLAVKNMFKNFYWIAADVGEMYRAGYANRAENTYQYVAGIDLTTPYGIPAYGDTPNGR